MRGRDVVNVLNRKWILDMFNRKKSEKSEFQLPVSKINGKYLCHSMDPINDDAICQLKFIDDAEAFTWKQRKLSLKMRSPHQ